MSNYVQLREITSKIGAGATPTGGKNAYHSQGISFIRSQNVHDFKFSLDGLAFIDEKQAKELNNVTVEENDILLNITGDSIARVCVVPNKILPARVNQHVAIIRCISNVDCHYVFYYLENLKPYLLKICGVGGTRNALTKEAIEKLEIHLPEISTQQKIASVLSALDSKIELNNRINAELEAMAKTLYDYWFVQFDFPDKNGKPYKTSGGKMVWNEELKREIPEGWEVKKVKEFASTGSGSTPIKSKKEYYLDGNVPWINSGEVNNPFIVEAKKYITQLGLNSASTKLFKRGTLLIAMYGATAGKVSILDIEACTNQAICSINVHNNSHRNYLKFVLDDLYEYLINLSTGSARDNLSQDKIKELIVLMPDDLSIQKFDKLIEPTYDKILNAYRENQKLTELRDWLLPMLMNGQVKVSEL